MTHSVRRTHLVTSPGHPAWRTEKVSVLARLTGRGDLPKAARIVTQFGEIAAIDLPRRALPAFSRSSAVESVERPPSYHVNQSVYTHKSGPDLNETNWDAAKRRPDGLRATGKGCVIAVLDWGVDFAHPNLIKLDPRDNGPSSRFLGIFDQRGPDTNANRWGYGRIILQDEINAALREEDPYAALGYHPGTADVQNRSNGRWQGSHGTHVIDIAAGNGQSGGPIGVAPEADLLFVHLSRSHPLIGPGSLGDSNTNILHALDWCLEMAGNRPIVVNASLGSHNAAHDGTNFTEIGVDRALAEAPGRVMVNSAGNYFQKAAHASGAVENDAPKALRFFVPPNDPTPSELELWHAPVDQITISLRLPNVRKSVSVRFGGAGKVYHKGEVIGHLTYGPRNNGDVAFWLLIAANAPAGIWSLSLRPNLIVDGRFHAWIERDGGLQPRFIGEDVDPSYTTGSICNGMKTITVGATDNTAAQPKMAPFSSSGPTRDGRVKPELVAPGVRIVAARSTPPGAVPGARHVAKSGTSMAAPQVAGTIALMQEAAGQPLSVDQVRRLLFSTLSRPDVTDADQRTPNRLGYGVLDIAAAEQAARQFRAKFKTQED